jgi:spoIIIJ-associated protein
MRSIESEGETIDQAIETALRALDVLRDQVQVDILMDATRGVLGFGGRKARVRATVRAPLSSRVPGLASDMPELDSRETSPATPAPGRAENPPAAGSASVAPAQASGGFEVRCQGALEGILSRIGVSYSVTARPGPDPGSVLLEVSGDSSGLLIGRRGQTLDALEYVVNRIVGRDDQSTGRVMIDVEHYRERRYDHLTELARRLGEKAKQSGRPVTLDPMSARDRRVVHLALQDDPAIATRSEGDGHFRKVIILPAERALRPSAAKPPAS